MAHLQQRTMMKPKSCSTARARSAMSTNRLAHREHRIVRAASNSRLEELKDRGGAHTGDAADQCTFCRPTVFSQATAIGRRQSPLPCRCRASVGTAIWQWPEEQEVHPCLGTTCQLLFTPAGDSEWMASDMAADFGHSRRGRTLQGANRASSLFVLVAVGSVVAPENTVMISASVSARARSHQGLLYISSDDPFS